MKIWAWDSDSSPATSTYSTTATSLPSRQIQRARLIERDRRTTSIILDLCKNANPEAIRLLDREDAAWMLLHQNEVGARLPALIDGWAKTIVGVAQPDPGNPPSQANLNNLLSGIAPAIQGMARSVFTPERIVQCKFLEQFQQFRGVFGLFIDGIERAPDNLPDCVGIPREPFPIE
jgi:hypothetical protein